MCGSALLVDYNSSLSRSGHRMKSRLSVVQLFGIMPNKDHCCVPFCTNNGSKGGTGITFHRFPTNRNLKTTWIVKIRRDVGKTFQVSDVFFPLKLCFTLHSRVSVACEAQTHFRSSLLSLRKIVSANPSG